VPFHGKNCTVHRWINVYLQKI